MNEQILFKNTIKHISIPSTVYGYVADSYLDGLHLYQLLKDIPTKDTKITIEYTEEGMIFQVTKKEK